MCGQEMSFSLIYLQYTLVRKQEWWCYVLFSHENQEPKRRSGRMFSKLVKDVIENFLELTSLLIEVTCAPFMVS